MKTKNFSLFLIVILSSSISGCSSISHQSAERKPSSTLSVEEQVVLDELNKIRRAHGLNEFVVLENLQSAAEHHSEYMSKNRLLAHNEPSPFETPQIRISGTNTPPYTTGENIACGRNKGAEAVVDWMDSPPHKENILHPEFVFIGISKKGLGNRINSEYCTFNHFWTTTFAGLPVPNY